MKKTVLILLFGLLFISLTAQAADKNTKNSKAVEKNTAKEAAAGDISAQIKLGRMYITGVEIPKNYDEGILWLEKAAQAGSAEAQNELGEIYLAEDLQDYDKALMWFKLAASQNYTKSINNLASMYFNGNGVEQNSDTAVNYYKQSAQLKDIQAMIFLGSYYLRESRYDKSFYWYQKAADTGDPEGQYYLGSMYNSGEGIDRDENEAIKWLLRSSKQGYLDAKFSLAAIYYDRKDYNKALALYRELAKQDNSGAQKNLGDMYYRGEGVKQDYKEAFQWYEKAAQDNLPEAQYMLGIMYCEGIGIAENYEKGIELIQKAAQQGLPEAQERVELMVN